MRVTLWGTRGSLACAGPETLRYGGNTSCVEVCGRGGTRLVLDAGTGIRYIGADAPQSYPLTHVLLTHLHMDHILGLGFFQLLFDGDRETTIWGPPSTTHDLRMRLARYLSPPLFPMRIRDLPGTVTVRDLPCEKLTIGEFTIVPAFVYHPGPTVGFRVHDGRHTLTYLPDHEPALGADPFPGKPEWTSGFDLAADCDLLIHDAQYTAQQYRRRVGWGHSSIPHAVAFARHVRAKRLVLFHHDPSHSDDILDRLFAEALRDADPTCQVIPGRERDIFDL